MNIFSLIFKPSKKVRSTIIEPAAKPSISKDSTRHAARNFINSYEGELSFIAKVNDLLNAPLVELDRNRHLMATLEPKPWLNDNKPLVVLFSVDTDEPICAYFREEQS